MLRSVSRLCRLPTFGSRADRDSLRREQDVGPRIVTGMCRLLLTAYLAFFAAGAGADTRPVLRIASDASFPPFHFIGDDGVGTGYDIELARAVAEHAGYRANVRIVAYAALFTGIEDGSHDVVAATTGMTAEREARYLFSSPYFETCQVAVVRSGANEPRRRIIELADRRIGAAGSGSSAQAMYEVLAAEHVAIPDGQGPALLASRRIDAWITDEFEAVAFARASFGEYVVLPDPVAKEAYGFVMAGNRHELRDDLNDALLTLRNSGLVEELEERFRVVRDREWPVRCDSR